MEDLVTGRELETLYKNEKDCDIDLSITLKSSLEFIRPRLEVNGINRRFAADLRNGIWYLCGKIKPKDTYEIVSNSSNFKNFTVVLSWIEKTDPYQIIYPELRQNAISERDEALQKLKELDAEHTKLGAMLLDIHNVLGLSPTSPRNAKHNLAGALEDCKKKGFDQVCENTITRVVSQLNEVENLLSFLFSDGQEQVKSPYVMGVDFPKKANLKIACKYVNGQLQIGYMRDDKGIEHNLDNGGNLAFYINVEIDEYLLKQNIPEFQGKTQKG